MCAEIPKKEVVKQFYNGAVLMKLVPYKGQDTHPNGVAFYVNNGQGGVIGVRVYPDGRKVAVNPTMNITDGTNFPTMRRYSQRYQIFTNAWGHHISIYASHAVYTAWSDKPIQPIPKGMTIDHIDGVAQNNDFRNLRCVSNEINNRDGGFLRKLRHMGFNPACIERAYLLRYYDRMAIIKASITEYRYRHLTKEQLRSILYLPDEELKIKSLIQTPKNKKNMPNDLKKLHRVMRTAHVLQKGDEDHKFGQSLALKQAWWFESFRDALNNGFAQFTYYKKDGTTRSALGTRSPALIPADKQPKGDMSDGSTRWEDSAKAIPYFDLDRNEWRSFSVFNFVRLDRVWKFNKQIA